MIGGMYRVPGTDVKYFNYSLTSILEKASTNGKDRIYAGDFNLNLLNSVNHQDTARFLYINTNFCLKPTCTNPTRITNTTHTLIDNIFTSYILSRSSYKGILVTYISDHFPIFYMKESSYKYTYNAHKIAQRWRRTYTTQSTNNFIADIERANYNAVISYNNPQTAYNSLIT